MTNYFWTVHKRQLDEILKRLAAQSEHLEQLDVEDEKYVKEKYQKILNYVSVLAKTKKDVKIAA